MRWFAKSRPWLLLASLSVNLFLVAAIGAAVAFGPLKRPPHPPPFRHMMAQVDVDARAQFRAAFDARRADIRAAGDANRAARSAYRAALKAEPFDPSALAAAMEGRRAARQRLRALTDSVFLEVAPKLDAETRRKLADMRWKRGRRPPRPDQSGGR